MDKNKQTILNIAAAVTAVIALVVSITHGHGDPNSERCEKITAEVTTLHDRAEKLLVDATDDEQRTDLELIADDLGRIICGVPTDSFAADLDDHRDTLARISEARS